MNLQNNKLKNFTPLPNEIFSLHLSIVELVNMEPFMEVYENTWQTLNSLLSRVG